jgi:hypothetical protein
LRHWFRQAFGSPSNEQQGQMNTDQPLSAEQAHLSRDGEYFVDRVAPQTGISTLPSDIRKSLPFLLRFFLPKY